MGYIQQINSAIADSKQLTLSFWFIIPSQATLKALAMLGGVGSYANVVLFETLRSDGFDNGVWLAYRYVDVGLSTERGYLDLYVTDIGSVDQSLYNWAYWITKSDNGVYNIPPYRSIASYETLSAIPINYNGWNHLIFAVNTDGYYWQTPDGSNGTTDACGPPTGTPKVAKIVLNGQYINGPIDMYGFVQTELVYHDDTGPWGEGNANTNGASSFLPSFSGMNVGIPVNGGTTVAVKMADLQLWVGQFIDPTVSENFAKFVSISNNVGRPVDPAIAATAFGEQTLLHMGGANAFFINRGSGGVFTKSGTISDYTPTPTYA